MTNTQAKSRRRRQLKSNLIVNNRRLTNWLVNCLPHYSNQVLKWLNRWQLQLLIGSLLVIFIPLITIRPSIVQQGMVALLLIAAGKTIVNLEEQQTKQTNSESLHLLLIFLSLITTLRYLYYRTQNTLNFEDPVSSFFCILLLSAELYAILTLALSYFQTLKIKDRKPIPLDESRQDEWLKVDIYIPTYNEDVDIVRKTTLGAVAIDYPAAKKQVYILDDGRPDRYPEHDPRHAEFKARRDSLRRMCEEIGCSMLTRDDNSHAKAGNINTAFRRTDGDLVLILDCDHIPTRNILKETVGFFTNPKVALVQTPHWFYNPDPFERNLLTRGLIPVGNELFYKVLQKGNDFWNAAFFCGSAAVIRKEYVLQVGGIATETVTEDCHTSFRLHSLGYESVYYDKIMIAGLAPEKCSAYVGQQVRWARGMAQILRIENPLLNPKLNLDLPQRLCYFSATSHFFFGFPRLMYVVAPILFLLFGINSVRGLGLETLFYALPHIILSMQTNHIPYKHVRFSFWNEIYEFAMSFQAGIVTLLALVNPKLGSFNVTDKGLTVTKRSFDFESVRYLVLLAAISSASLFAVPFWLVLRPEDTQAVLINTLWSTFNLLLLVASCLVAFEQPQIRASHRLPRKLTAIVHSDGESWTGETLNVSETGALILLDSWPNIPDEIKVEIVGDYGARVLVNAKIIRGMGTDSLQTKLAVQFVNLTRTQKDDLTIVLFSDVAEWYSQRRAERDQPIQSLKFIASSMKRAFLEFRPEIGMKVRKQVKASAHLYWEGWEGNSYLGSISEIGSDDLRVELVVSPSFQMDSIANAQPLLGMLVSQHPDDSSPYSLLAQVESISLLSSYPPENPVVNKIALELSFPDSLNRNQQRKIKQLVRTLE